VKRGQPIRRQPWQKPKPVTTLRETLIDPDLRALVRRRANGCCELCGDHLGPDWHAHHRQLRSRGGKDTAVNLVALCSFDHRKVHSHPAWSSEMGWMVSAYDDPATVAVAVLGRTWRLLTPDGTYRNAETGAVA
jgi:hypothetical protein